jgi:hypothetical protein
MKMLETKRSVAYSDDETVLKGFGDVQSGQSSRGPAFGSVALGGQPDKGVAFEARTLLSLRQINTRSGAAGPMFGRNA